MQNIKITLVQADQIWEEKEKNLSNYTRLLKNVSESDVILLPEMFHTGFSMNAKALAEKMNNSIGILWLKEMAKEKNSAIYTSLIVEENGNYYNRGVFVYPSGKIETYDKRKTFGLAGEDKIYTTGKSEKIIEYKDWKFQLQICYDLRFPEVARNRITSNQKAAYDVILYVSNWPEKRSMHWKTLLKARAIENQSYVVGVNRVGIDGKEIIYSGDSVCINALGEEIKLNSGNEEVKIVTLSNSELNAIRENLPFLKDR